MGAALRALCLPAGAGSEPYVFIVRAGKAIICNHLPPAVGPTAFGRSAPEKRRGIDMWWKSGCGWVGPEVSHLFRDETAEKMGHPFFSGEEKKGQRPLLSQSNSAVGAP